MASELHPLRSALQIWLSLGTSSLQIQNGNFYPIGTQNCDIQMRKFLTWIFLFFYFMLLFVLKKKNQNLLDIQEHCICKLGKIQSELKPLSGVYY